MANIKTKLHFPSFQHTLDMPLKYGTYQWSLKDYKPEAINTYVNFIEQKLAFLRMYDKDSLHVENISNFPQVKLKYGEVAWGREQCKGSWSRNLWMPITRQDLRTIKRTINEHIKNKKCRLDLDTVCHSLKCN